MTDEEFEKYIDEEYERLDQQFSEMRELGLLNYGDSSYYIQNLDEYEKDKKICELENEVERLEHRLSNCIEPKFKIGQEIWDVVTQRYWEIKKFELIPLEGQLCEMYRLGHGDTGDYNSCLLPYDGNQFFATEEEAKICLDSHIKECF